MTNAILEVSALTRPWGGIDPFLFCAHHLDRYPASDGAMGVPLPKLGGRPLGNDFSNQDGFSQYFGERVPGFPAHPHRGFETITYLRRGHVDHSDSMGATARYGAGDVQWLTAGRGIQHAEMFPLLDRGPDNTLELFQIWFNLPASDKFVEPEFKMLWGEQLPVWRQADPQDASAINEVTVIAGTLTPAGGKPLQPPSPPRHSWAAREDSEVAIWVLRLSPGQRLSLPAAVRDDTRRVLHVFAGETLRVDGQELPAQQSIELRATSTCEVENNGSSLLEIMLMQGRPIGEPVAAGGPFVMNTDAELHQARVDYGRTSFGGWPWQGPAPVHPADADRFARYPGSNTIELPPSAQVPRT